MATAENIYVDPSALLKLISKGARIAGHDNLAQQDRRSLELKYFATFDMRQQQLARAVGLKLVTPGA